MQSLNLYAYCGNDPINSNDPMGTDGPTFIFNPFPFPGGGGGGLGGFLGGLFNFGAGLFGSIFGGNNRHIIGPPFLGIQLRPTTPRIPQPKRQIVALYGQYS